MSQNIFIILVASQGIVGLAAFCALFFVSAPYGKHSRPGWGPRLSSKLAWIVMETPAVLVPPGMLLALVSTPNYLGEIIQWISKTVNSTKLGASAWTRAGPARSRRTSDVTTARFTGFVSASMAPAA